MTPDQRWQRIQQLSEQLESLPADARQPKLEQLEPDSTVRAEVLDFLAALAAEAAQRQRMIAAIPVPAPLPVAIGPYRILSRLGQGGTSTVYQAQQQLDSQAPSREVALKVLNAFLSSPTQTERFQREFAILSRLDHPNICRVLDAGITPEQQPYLVLELLDASPIDAYSDAHRLNLHQRIALAVEAAEAMAYAHRNLIAHLDLKPGNLLVTAAGRVKVLDFGTAKLLEPFGNLTTTRYLTPLYASPEQLRGDPVSTACDIYSLGLIVFVLLAGELPFPSSIAALAERASGATTAPRLSQRATAAAASVRDVSTERLRQLLTGDLEQILARALTTEPDRRYPSMADFAEDLRRFLDQRPILARKQTVSYRLSKFVRRHRLTVALASVAFLATAISGTVAVVKQREALAEGRRAKEFSSFLGWLLTSSNPIYGGRDGMTVMEMMGRADDLLAQGIVQDPAVTTSIESMVGTLMATGGGDSARGLALVERAYQRASRSGDRTSMLSAGNVVLQMLLNRGDCPAALKLAESMDQQRRAIGDTLPPMLRISTAVDLDVAFSQCGKDASGSRIAAALPLLSQIPDGVVQDGTSTRLFKALVWNGHSNLLSTQGSHAQALAAANDGLRLASADPNGRNIRVALLQARGRAQYGLRDVAASADSYLEAAHLAANSATPFEAIRLKVQAGQRLAEAGRSEEALQLANDAVTLASQNAAALGDKRWMVLIDAAITYSRLHRCAETYALLAEADVLTKGQMPPSWKANRYGYQADCLAAEGKTQEASASASQALAAAGASWPPKSSVRKRMEALLAK